MKTIEVAAAIIRREGKILATERGYGEFAGGWEFPGGKLEQGEDGMTAAVREIREELDVSVAVERLVCTVSYDYPAFHLVMHCYLCHVEAGQEMRLLEHAAARWLDADGLDSVDWLPADIAVVQAIRDQGILG